MHKAIDIDSGVPPSQGTARAAGAVAEDGSAPRGPAVLPHGSRFSPRATLDDLREAAALFHTPSREPWVAVSSDGRRESLRVGGQAFRT